MAKWTDTVQKYARELKSYQSVTEYRAHNDW